MKWFFVVFLRFQEFRTNSDLNSSFGSVPRRPNLSTQVGTSVVTSQGRPFLTTLLSFCIELPMTIGVVGFVVFVGLPQFVHGHLEFIQGSIYDVYWVQFLSTLVQFGILFVILSRSNWRKFAHETQVHLH